MQHNLTIASNLNNLKKVSFFLDEFFYASCLDRNYFNRVLLGLSEAVYNSILHGNALDENKRVFIRLEYSKNILIVEVNDEGCGFEYRFIDDPTSSYNLKKENGRGIFLINQIADDVEFSDKGRRVRIKYNLTK